MLLRCSHRIEQRGSMIDISESERRRAFSIWSRTGRLPSVGSADGIELKFNPWHDPKNGRFTFVGAGRRYDGRSGEGGGAIVSGDWSTRPFRPKPQNPASRETMKEPARPISSTSSAASSKASVAKTSASGTWARGRFTGGGGVSFGGAGASGIWRSPEPKLRPSSSSGSATIIVSSERRATTATASPRPASVSSEKFRTVVRNGYD